jgi:uncharacterized protein
MSSTKLHFGVVPRAILNQHVAVLGKTRSGKSSVMRGLVEGLLDERKPVCIIDPKGDWWGLKLKADGKRPGFPVVIFGGEHADIPINEHAGHSVAELFATGNRPCLIDLGGWMPAARTRFWIDFASTLFRLTKGERWIAIDEVHNFAPKAKLMSPDATMALHWTNRLASEGLGKGLQMIFASQRPQKVHNDTLTSAETLIAMRVLHPSDRGAVSEWIKGCGDSGGDEVLRTLGQMVRGEAWVWSPEIGFGPKRVQFPMFSTYDSFRMQTLSDSKRLRGWASVDLDEIRTKFASIIDESKSNDPRELKKTISELRKQLSAQPAPAVQTKTVERVVLKDGQLQRAEQLVLDIRQLLGTHAQQQQRLTEQHLGGFEKLLGKLALTASGLSDAIQQTTRPRPGNEPAAVSAALPASARAPVTSRQRQKNDTAQNDTARLELAGFGDVTPAQQKLLNALAFLASIGVRHADKRQLAIFVRSSPTSGTYLNKLGALRTAGLIDYPSPRTVALTGPGGTVASPVGVPKTTAELHDAIKGALTPTKWRILRELIGIYPQSLTKDELAIRVDLAPGSGTFLNYLGSLRTLGLVDYPEKSRAAASQLLFL